MLDVSDREVVYLSGNGKVNEEMDVSNVDEIDEMVGGAQVHLHPLTSHAEAVEPEDGEEFIL